LSSSSVSTGVFVGSVGDGTGGKEQPLALTIKTASIISMSLLEKILFKLPLLLYSIFATLSI
jgi:hypothetical protein